MSVATTPRPLTVYAGLVLSAAVVGCLVVVGAVPEERSSRLDLLSLVPAAIGLPVLVLTLRRRGPAGHVRPADAVTVARAVVVAWVAGWAVLVALGSLPATSWWLLSLALLALMLDGVDGAVARRTDSASQVGAVLDAETDAVMMLTLSVIAAHQVGLWIVLAGGLRYVFGVVDVTRWSARSLPPRPLPARSSRRVIAAVSAVGLAATTAPVLGASLTMLLSGVALALLLVSFGLDAIWLEFRADRGVVGDVVGRAALERGVDPTDVFTQNPQTQQLECAHRSHDHHG